MGHEHLAPVLGPAGLDSGQTYDYIVKLVREYGKYPLQLDDSARK